MERVDADLIPFAKNNTSGYRFAFGTDTATDDINANYNDNIKKGWGTTPNEFPEVEDFNAMAYTSSYLTAYLYQMGISEWNNKQKYKKYSRVIGSDGKIYKAKKGTDLSPNVNNNPTTDTTNWEDVLGNFVTLTGNQTIAGIKTFSSNIIGSITGNADSATKLATARTINGVTFDGSANITVDDATAVKLTGNQTIAGIKTFSSNIIGSITGNAGSATKLATARTINGVTFDGSANITVDDATAVKLTGNQTIAGIKTFSSNIIGSITGNADSATKLLGDEMNWASYRSRSVANMLGWKNYGNEHCIFDASHGTTPNDVAISNTDSVIPWSPACPTLMGWNGTRTHGVRVDSARVADSARYAAAFTTAVGFAPSYACRAWVNFNGTGTVAIRASGNVSSITDNGVGNYTVNFTVAMPDANYSEIVGCGVASIAPVLGAARSFCTGNRLSTAISVVVSDNNVDNPFDNEVVNVSIFR